MTFLSPFNEKEWVFPTGLLDNLMRMDYMPSSATEAKRAFFAPKVHLAEREKQYLLNLDLPGVQEKDITITAQEDSVKIEGKREVHYKEGDHVEYQHGAFMRSFRLPENANSDAIEAHFRNGVLTLEVPKKESPKSKGKTIAIGTAR